ncbi:MAG: molybdenum cofactor biosynthesis protein [Acidimicrobiaceae bacterium]|nr:molybdenum cofactor biosynthesis protein [Acidimicrobiaceae bacterium]
MPEQDRLTHLNERGEAHMVDVSAKPTTARQAVARCRITMAPETAAAIVAGTAGTVLVAARVAGLMAAKSTPELVPLCHKVLLGDVTVDFVVGEAEIEIEARAAARDRTGVEIEALTACMAAALTVYASCKSRDRTMVIEDATLLEKTGGRTGTWRRLADGTVVHEEFSGERRE